MDDDDLYWRTALHEAGHSVAGRLLGRPCGDASADPWHAFATVPLAVDVESVVVLMSGAIAERLVLGDCDEVGAANDCVRWTALLRALGDDDGYLWAFTSEMLAGYSDAVVRLAGALMDAGWLSGDQIDALLTE